MRLGGPELHGALLVAALVLAWLSWTAAEEEPAGTEVPVWDLGAAEISEVGYSDERREVSLTTRLDEAGGEAALWARTVKKSKPASEAEQEPGAEQKPETEAEQEPGAEQKPEPEPEQRPEPEKPEPKEPEIKEFRVNEKGNKAVARLRKPMAKRALGKVDPDREDELGLKTPEGTLSVRAGSKTRTLEVGTTAFGGGLRYVRDRDTGAAFVVEAAIVDDFRWADARLVERELHAFKRDELSAFSIERGETRKGWTKRTTAEGADPVWIEAGAVSAEADESAATWLSKLFRLRAHRYVRDSEDVEDVVAARKEEARVLRVSLSAGEKMGFLDLRRVGEDKEARFFARTEHTRGFVGVSRYLAEDLLRDLKGLLPE